MVQVQVSGEDLGFGFMGKKKEQNDTGAEVATDEHGTPGEEQAAPEADEDTVPFDPDLLCAACNQVGHNHKSCPQLEESLCDKRDWQEIAPGELLFPRWEIPLMTFIIAGVSSSTGAVLNAAVPTGCHMMYACAAAVVPILVFQVFIFYQVHNNVFSKRSRVWWRANDFQDASTEKWNLAKSNWAKSRLKAKNDYFDALTSTGMTANTCLCEPFL